MGANANANANANLPKRRKRSRPSSPAETDPATTTPSAVSAKKRRIDVPVASVVAAAPPSASSNNPLGAATAALDSLGGGTSRFGPATDEDGPVPMTITPSSAGTTTDGDDGLDDVTDTEPALARRPMTFNERIAKAQQQRGTPPGLDEHHGGSGGSGGRALLGHSAKGKVRRGGLSETTQSPARPPRQSNADIRPDAGTSDEDGEGEEDDENGGDGGGGGLADPLVETPTKSTGRRQLKQPTLATNLGPGTPAAADTPSRSTRSRTSRPLEAEKTQNRPTAATPRRGKTRQPTGPDDDDDDPAPDETPSKRTGRKRGLSPPIKGILTPSRRDQKEPVSLRKTVSFGPREKKSLADPPISAAAAAATKKEVVPDSDEDEDEDEDEDGDEEVCAICSQPDSAPPNEIVFCETCDLAVHQRCYDIPEIPEGDWLCRDCCGMPEGGDAAAASRSSKSAAAGPAQAAAAAAALEIPNFESHLCALQRILVDRCTGRRRLKLLGQADAYDKTRRLVEQTVLTGEGNSMMIMGPRGSGKTTLIESIVSELRRDHRQHFHVVRLNGFIHTDDKLALREIWRQLGKEMDVMDDDLMGRTSHADTLASLLALLSHPTEITGEAGDGLTSQSVVFIMDEFDMFAAHPRQTLLYNLFDIAQARKAPIAVIGATTRLDVVEMLEKRVKSRFSHRYAYVAPAPTPDAYWEICQQGLLVDQDELAAEEGLLRDDDDNYDDDDSLPGLSEFMMFWTDAIEDLHRQDSFQRLLRQHFYTTKSIPGFLAAWILPLSQLTAEAPILMVPHHPSATMAASVAITPAPAPAPAAAAAALADLQPPTDPKLHLVLSLSDLDLALLIAAARLDIIAHTDMVNFAMAYDEYAALMGRQRVQSAAAGLLATSGGGGGRVWGRVVAAQAWERLATLGLLLPGGGAAGGSRGGGGSGLGMAEGRMWRMGVALEEIPRAAKLNNMMAKWCREI